MKSILLLGTLFTLWFLQTDGLYKVKLGKAPDCNGFNFCGISANNNDATDAKQENEVLAQITAKDKFIQFSFLKRTVNDKLFLKYFATGTFILDDDFTFNEEICTILELKKCSLKAGKYTIADEYDKYVVEFVY
jgi:hypothetical protein